MLGTILSEHKKMFEHKKGTLNYPYVWNFHYKIMIGYMLHLDCSMKDNNGKPTMVATDT